jgi:serine/threonine protein kinase
MEKARSVSSCRAFSRPHTSVVVVRLFVYVWSLLLGLLRGRSAPVDAGTAAGPYTLEEKIGEGGMGVVYRARHALLERPAAVKLLSNRRRGDLSARLFAREVQLTSRLTHPNVISIYDYGTMPNGSFYYAMEYVDGVTLDDLVAHDGPQPAARVAQLLGQVCGALEEAHGLGLVHRDIKPSNLMLCMRGRTTDQIKVLDFGLVTEASTSADGEDASSSLLMGTPLYMAPEAYKNPAAVDGRADLYALGVVGYFLLAGASPFSGKTLIEACMKQLHEDPIRPSLRTSCPIPRALEDLVMACLARDPAERPRSATEVMACLEQMAPELEEWTRDDAARWWSTRGRTIRSLLAQGEEVDVNTETLPVCLAA